MKKMCFFSKKGLTDFQFYDIIIYVAEEISNKLLPRSVGQGVKTPPFHGGITGSNPVRTIPNFRQNGRKFFCNFL